MLQIIMFGRNPKKISPRKIVFTCSKDQIFDLNDGQGNWSIEELKAFSVNGNVIIIIFKYATIENGEFNLMQ